MYELRNFFDIMDMQSFEKTVSSLKCLDTVVKKPSDHVWIYFKSLFCFDHHSHCPDYYRFLVSLDIMYMVNPEKLILFPNCFDYSNSIALLLKNQFID